VQARSSSDVTLLLDRREGDPFSYIARLGYSLSGSALEVVLDVTNTGGTALPFGLGLHPWLPRRPGVTLRTHALGTWSRGPLGLPMEAIDVPAAWNFGSSRTLPEEHVDHVFRGWDGRAQVNWPDTGLGLEIEADMGYYILYAPVGADFFCFEPVDHAINAHNLPGGPAQNGLTVLAPGCTLARRVRFGVRAGER
jgi:aldose 1-epimerase